MGELISGMFNEATGKDKTARIPVRMLSMQFDLAGFNAATQTVGNGLNFNL